MNKKQRQKNETEYEQWIEREDESRVCSFEISGKSGWKAGYLKEVNTEEITIRF